MKKLEIFQLIFSALGIIVSIFGVFHISIGGKTMMGNSYLYLLMAIYMPLTFLTYPHKGKFHWADALLAAISFVCLMFFFVHGYRILVEGWETLVPSPTPILGGFILMAILLISRRTTGTAFFSILVFFFSLPLWANYIPGAFQGTSLTPRGTIGFLMMSQDGVVGIAMSTFGSMIIGYMIFASAVICTGGGTFLTNLTMSLLGTVRGGGGKGCVVASGLFGMISGSVISNTMTAGAMTIPIMKRTGFPPHVAAGIETCASTGGVLMPPVMGVTAFVLASFLGVPYWQVCVAASVPSILYYLSLFFRVDAIAARMGISGLSRDGLPSMSKTLKDGWHLLFGFLFLILFLFYTRLEHWAPYFATAILLVSAMIKPSTRPSLNDFKNLLLTNGKTLAMLVAVLSGIGIIMGSLTVTGLAHALSFEIVSLAGGNIPVIILLGAITSFILGMGMTVTACYIFLALVLAPVLIKAGCEPMATHLFILYCGMLSYITPPVAIAAFAAAGIAGSNPMKTGYTAMSIGLALFILPFAFIADPALILREASIIWSTQAIISAGIGIWLFGCGTSRYMNGVGTLPWRIIPLPIIAGLLLLTPIWQCDIAGLVLGGMTFYLGRIMKGGRRNG
jgi:TRAP transporter 4TM/12TM fusion protein